MPSGYCRKWNAMDAISKAREKEKPRKYTKKLSHKTVSLRRALRCFSLIIVIATPTASSSTIPLTKF